MYFFVIFKWIYVKNSKVFEQKGDFLNFKANIDSTVSAKANCNF